MSKMNDMAMTIEELRSAAAAINEAANWLATQFAGTTDEPPAAKPAAKEEKKPELKLEDTPLQRNDSVSFRKQASHHEVLFSYPKFKGGQTL